MTPPADPYRLRGVFAALVTPLDSARDVDTTAVGRLVDHTLAGGVHGLLALGSTGELTALDGGQRQAMLRAVIEHAAGRVPVLAGVAQTSLSAARAEVQAVAEAGASAALVTPPFYGPIDQAGVLRFYRALAETSLLPIVAYNIPAFTKVSLEQTTVERLWHDAAIVGIKDSSRDFEYFERVLASTRGSDFAAFTGTDTMLLGSLAMGAAGTICVSANLAPHVPVRLYNAVRTGDWSAAVQHQDDLLRLVFALRVGVFPAGVKAALALAGLCQPWPAEPTQLLTDAEQARLRELLPDSLLGVGRTQQ